MKQKVLSLCLSIIFVLSTTSYGFADTDLDNPPTEPTKPSAESYEDNDKIENYNKEVENYNKEAEEYNKAVDEEYSHQKKEIDEQNKTEQERVNKANEEKTKQYEIDKKQYEKDKEFEEKVLADPRYDSLDQYNEAVDNYNKQVDKYNNSVTNYHKAYDMTNEEAAKSPERNKNAREVKIEETYMVEEPEVASNRLIPVHIEHIFTGTDVKYEIDFEIDSNSTITLTGIAPKTDCLNDQSCLFFYNTDENHLLGMWSNAISYLMNYPTATVENGWSNGDTHTISYEESSNEYFYDFEDITMIYEYLWIPLYQTREHYPYANKPKEPILELEEFKALPYPQKRAYLNYLSTLPYFQEPVSEEEIPKIKKVIEEKEAVAVSSNEDSSIRITSNNDSNNLETALVKKDAKTSEEIVTARDRSVPKTNYETDYWALINLIATLLTFLITFLLLLMIIINKRKEDDEIKIYQRIPGRILSIIVSIIAGIIFLLTEDMSLPMALVDEWTLLMIIILIIQIIIMAFCKHKKKEQEE